MNAVDRYGASADLSAGAKHSLPFQIAATSFGVFVFVLLGACALTLFKFERVFLETAERRFDSTLQSARAATENSLGPGLTLASNYSSQIIINNKVEQQDGAFSLSVTNLEGGLLFSAHNQTPPVNLREIIRDIDMAEAAEPARHSHEQVLSASVPIFQDGEPVGFIVLSFIPQDAISEMARIRSVLWQLAVVTAIVFAPAIGLLSYFMLLPIERRALLQAEHHSQNSKLNDDDLGVILSTVEQEVSALEMRHAKEIPSDLTIRCRA